MINTLVTYLEDGDNPAKAGIIPDKDEIAYATSFKDLSLREGPMAHQLVGGVKAHQG